MQKIKHWISAFRPRTLTLSFSGIFVGSMLAYRDGFFNITIFVLALFTALSLQILSNLANDYGDFEKGTDNKKRSGPQRAMQSGNINKKEMKSMIIFFIILSLALGIITTIYSLWDFSFTYSSLFFILGILAVIAALKYTMGNHAYGYSGLGDLFVFIFFGLLSVLGSYFILGWGLPLLIMLPAIAVGFLNVGVLNINNMRDEENDRMCNKKTLVVFMGNQKAKMYHSFLILGAISLFLIYTLMTYQQYTEFLYLIPTILLIIHLRTVLNNKAPKTLDIELKRLAISTFLVCLFFGIGLIL